MKYSYALGQQEFNALLGLFSANREEAGEKYEQIRAGLIRFFQFKGCADPQGLADETINRVAAKLHAFDTSKNIQLVSYFYGFASNILMEYRRKAAKESALADRQISAPAISVEENAIDPDITCLEQCMEELKADEKELVIEYYSRDRQERIELRHRICERLNCSAPTLYVRIFRIKGTLKDCIEACTKSRV